MLSVVNLMLKVLLLCAVYTNCCCAQYRGALQSLCAVKPSGIMLNVVVPTSVVILSVVMLSTVRQCPSSHWCQYVECCYVEFLLSVIELNVIALTTVVTFSVEM
jgi:hypothetical protein